MKKSTVTLIKLHKSYVDRTIDQLKLQREGKEKVESLKMRTLEEVQEESRIHNELGGIFPLDRYLLRMRVKIEQYNMQIEYYQQNIIALEEKLREQYAELKKFEILQEHSKLREAEKARKLEIKTIDELNVMRFARKK